MSVTEHLSVTFSRPWWRRVLLAVICVYPVIGLVALWFDVTDGFGLSLLFDVAQLVLVWGGLLLLFAGTVFWIVGYDTVYAHQDREDDALMGLGSTASVFSGGQAKPWVAACYGAAPPLQSGVVE